jgi:hypothetical protein
MLEKFFYWEFTSTALESDFVSEPDSLSMITFYFYTSLSTLRFSSHSITSTTHPYPSQPALLYPTSSHPTLPHFNSPHPTHLTLHLSRYFSESLKAEAVGLTWYEWWENRTEEDVLRDEAEQLEEVEYDSDSDCINDDVSEGPDDFHF